MHLFAEPITHTHIYAAFSSFRGWRIQNLRSYQFQTLKVIHTQIHCIARIHTHSGGGAAP